MHSRFKRFLSAGLAALMSAAMLSGPSAVFAEEAELIDHNADGVIDVFDYVISKRASVAENSPLSLALSDAEGAPGSVVTITASVSDNTGFSSAKLIVGYDEGLEPAILEGEESVAIREHTAFPDLEITPVMIKKHSLVACYCDQDDVSAEDGTVLELAFRIPETAEPGMTYSLWYQDAELLKIAEHLPLLTRRGKITVTEPEENTEPVVTTTTAVTTSTTAVTTETQTTAETETAETTTAENGGTEDTTEVTTLTESETETETTTTVKTAPPYLYKGIDVSQYQGDINFEKVRDESENKFVIMRAGYGRFLDQEDPTFKTNYNRAKAAGIPVGAYWYSYASTPELARMEAHVCAQVLGDRQFEYPIVFDIEEQSVLTKPVEEVSAIIEAFCSEMEKMGYYVMLYCSSYYLNNRISPRTIAKYSVWVAHYNVACPTFYGEFGMWQYGIGTCPGIDADVDVDYCYRDYEEIIKRVHRNGF
ncbi:MAG: glycoside hydrolase family 25 protein [Oscillospiraceae bacterium]|nr:glycoside hydrolase family 25 protein [Oscillospiraceae bacterium]